jgi:uncharacterized protein (TIGR03086 family)
VILPKSMDVMTTNLRTYTRALYGLDHIVRLVPAHRWSNQSPCDDWSARDVLGHVIGVQRLYEAVAREADPPDADIWDSPGHIAGNDPAASWSAALTDVLEALDKPDVLERDVDLFRGPETIDSLLGWNVVDTLAHTWDLAQATNIDIELECSLVQHALVEAEPMIEQLRPTGWFADEPPAPATPDAAGRFLSLVGRS